MAKITGAQIRERGKELKPARELAFKLCNQNPQIKWAELEDALKQEGYELNKHTIVAWVRRFTKDLRIPSQHSKRRRVPKAKPVRLFALKLFNENPEITGAALHQAIKENGFEASSSICYYWLKSFRKGSAIGTDKAKARFGPKPTPARLLAFKLWQENPQITGAQLIRALQEQGFQTKKNVYHWLKSFRNGKVVDTYEEKPVAAAEPSELTVEPRDKFTLEQIIEAAGSVETLSVLFYQGVMRELTRKDAVNHILKQECISKETKISNLKSLLNDVTRERNKIIREWNEKLAKVKVGTLTLDETTHRLVPKL